MAPNPILGVFLHWLGGLASASFYLPYRGVRKWSWETYWLVGGVFSWIIAPWCFASLLVPNLPGILSHASRHDLMWAYVFGALWGLGGLTFGLTMRYLGIGMGMAVALGYCTVFGTIIPPIVDGSFGHVAGTVSGRFVLLGIVVCVVGIVLSGLAGKSKELELPENEKLATVKEFDFKKGILIATFSGVLSSCMAYGLAAGKPIALAAKASLIAGGRSDIWQNLPVLIIVLLGGFSTNFVWCLYLNARNKSGNEYLAIPPSAVEELSATEGVAPWDASVVGGASVSVAEAPPIAVSAERKPSILRNYALSATAGVLWYLQFFFYSMGTVQMGKYDFSSWTLHMASIIIFSTLWGIYLSEWKGTSKRTHVLMFAGLTVLVLSTVVVGYGNYIKALTGP